MHAFEYFAEIGRSYKLALVPVTGLSRTKEYQASVATVVKDDKRGICLRLTPAEIIDAGFASSIRALLKSLGLTEDAVHLLVDYEANDPVVPSVESLLAAIPNLNKWQTLSVASGAFPPDLQGFEPGNRRIPRNDWLAWKKAVSTAKNRLRKPSFSDYTIQYGLYKEPVEGCNPSVSIRYTLDEEWLIMRGDAVRGKATSHAQETRPGREQWHGHAQLLCDDENLFYGEGFSWGDAFIHEKSLDSKNYGSHEIWLRAGINHHMTVVSRQIANLGVVLRHGRTLSHRTSMSVFMTILNKSPLCISNACLRRHPIPPENVMLPLARAASRSHAGSGEGFLIACFKSQK